MRSANQGFSLIELLIASSVGLIAIGIVGSVFLSGYQAANKRSLELLLQQDVNDAFRLIKEDTLRAGFNYNEGKSLRLFKDNGVSYADNIIYTTNNCIAYTYMDSDDIQKYNVFYLKDSMIKYKSVSASKTTNVICDVSNANSLLYEKQITVSDFKIEHKEISSASATSQLIKITLAAHLKHDDSVSTAKSIQIKARNWHNEIGRAHV